MSHLSKERFVKGLANTTLRFKNAIKVVPRTENRMACKVIVVGAGIIGASTAFQLQKSGAQVTVMDAGHAGATGASFGWINASFYENDDYYRLRVAGIAAHRALTQELSLPVDWCGCLCFETTGADFDAQRDALQDVGYAVNEIDQAKFAELEPHVANPPERCLMFQDEAAAESGALAAQLLQAAVDLGAQVIGGVAVTGFTGDGGRVAGVHSTAGTIRADQVVVAAGTATSGLMASIDVHLPMLKRPALMLKTQPVAPILQHVLASQIGEVRQLPCGSLLMPAAIGHQGDTSETLEASAPEVADAALLRLQALIPHSPLTWSHATMAYRPVPQDGMPVAGQVREGLYVATMHSGITLAAIMGQHIAREVLSGPSNETTQHLAPYRPERFAD